MSVTYLFYLSYDMYDAPKGWSGVSYAKWRLTAFNRGAGCPDTNHVMGFVEFESDAAAEAVKAQCHKWCRFAPTKLTRARGKDAVYGRYGQKVTVVDGPWERCSEAGLTEVKAGDKRK